MKLNLEAILKEQPTLTPFGIEGTRTLKTTEIFESEYLNQIESCIDWLSTRTVQKTINKRISSYGIKHILERELNTYVANGCFIVAVIHLGIPYEPIFDSPNIFVAIGMREIYRK